MNIPGYRTREIYDALNAWWDGNGLLSDVEGLLDSKRPFLAAFFYQSGVTRIDGSQTGDFSFQEAFNLLLLHLFLLVLLERKPKTK